MIDVRRARKPKARPEVFGLSTLDTVTCALGGSIMLFVMLAASTIPEAKVALVDIRKLFQTGGGSGGLAVAESDAADETVEIHNLAVIYVDTGEKTILSLKPTRCNDLDESILSMAGSSSQFLADSAGTQHAFAIWPEDASQISCKRVWLELDFDEPPGGCRTTLVSGNHYQERPSNGLSYAPCPLRLKLRSNGKGVFQFEAGP